ncbi:hypothetical protein [Shinella sp. BE166]|uniref:hypothetical protein n=1 Tax=unclassified Shinella TaxID=2643062 RepID=UPI003EBBFDBD
MPTPEKPCRDAVLAELTAVECTAENPVDLYLVGPTLISAGYTQQQIVSALDMLAYEKRLEYAGGNRVRVLR